MTPTPPSLAEALQEARALGRDEGLDEAAAVASHSSPKWNGAATAEAIRALKTGGRR